MTDLVLYDAANVPSPRRARMCLLEKGLPFTVRWLNLALMDQKRPEYLRLNPTGLVPTLVNGDEVVYESNVINEYVDALFPTPPLTPADPYGKARMRMWFAFESDWAKPFRTAFYETMGKDRIRGSGLSADQVKAEIAKRTSNPVYGDIAAKVLTTPRDDGVLQEQLALLFEKMDQMEAILGDGRPWLCGEAFSLADIALAPRLEMFPAIGVADLYDRYPRIGAFVARVKARPSWAKSVIVPEPGETERRIAA
jgi:glutathione S-transferase